MVVGEEDTIMRNIVVAALLLFPEITSCNEFKVPKGNICWLSGKIFLRLQTVSRSQEVLSLWFTSRNFIYPIVTSLKVFNHACFNPYYLLLPTMILNKIKCSIQLALHIYGFHFCRFNQPQIINIWGGGGNVCCCSRVLHG